MVSSILSRKIHLKIDHDCVHILSNLSFIGKVHVWDVVAFVLISKYIVAETSKKN
jgi:hypothetical protein